MIYLVVIIGWRTKKRPPANLLEDENFSRVTTSIHLRLAT